MARRCGRSGLSGGEGLGRTVRGPAGTVAEHQSDNIAGGSPDRGRCDRFRGEQALTRRRALGEAVVGLGRAIVAVIAAVAITRPGMAGVGQDGQLHQAGVNERPTRPERQEQREEERANSGCRATVHGPVSMARSRAPGNLFLGTRPWQRVAIRAP
jgi:hypothetical protein